MSKKNDKDEELIRQLREDEATRKALRDANRELKEKKAREAEDK